MQKETVTALEASVYESLLHSSLTSAYDDMLTAAQKAKKSLSAWSLTKLAAPHLSLSYKQKKPSAKENREIMSLMFGCRTLMTVNQLSLSGPAE